LESKLTNIDHILTQIRGDKSSRESCIRLILGDPVYNRGVEKIVRDRSGGKDDVVFVLHHTLVAFMKQVLENRDLQINNSLHSYLNGIAKYIWLGELRKKKKLSERETSFEYETHDMVDTSFELLLLDKEKNRVLGEVLSTIGEKCKKVLMLWAASYSMKEIAEQTGYNSEGVARKKKHQCVKSLSAYLDDNPVQKEMLKQWIHTIT